MIEKRLKKLALLSCLMLPLSLSACGIGSSRALLVHYGQPGTGAPTRCWNLYGHSVMEERGQAWFRDEDQGTIVTVQDHYALIESKGTRPFNEKQAAQDLGVDIETCRVVR